MAIGHSTGHSGSSSDKPCTSVTEKQIAEHVASLEASGASIVSIERTGSGAVIGWHPAGADAHGEPILTTLISRNSPEGVAHAEAEAQQAADLDEEIPVILDEEARRLRDLDRR